MTPGEPRIVLVSPPEARRKAREAARRCCPILSLLLACVLLALAGCNGATRAAALRHAEILRLEAAEPQLTLEQARGWMVDAADAFEVQAWRLGGDKPSAEVIERATGGAK